MLRFSCLLVLALCSGSVSAQPPKAANRVDAIRAALTAHGLPNLDGKWFVAGPFPFAGDDAFDRELPPDKEAKLDATYPGPDGTTIAWKPFDRFAFGKVLNLKPLFPAKYHNDSAAFLAVEFASDKAFTLPLSFGSDDTLTVYFNGRRLLHDNETRAAAPDQARAEASVRIGKNLLVVKVGQYAGEWEVYVSPEMPTELPEAVRKQIDKDFPTVKPATRSNSASQSAEAKYYAVDTFTPPENCVLEVGGMGFRPDGKLLACTRRGEVWLIDNPTSLNPKSATFMKYATGLHEALGLHVVDDTTTIIAQRPELTKLTAKSPNGPADSFTTISDRWGVSGDYHEYCFGPAMDRTGNAFLTLNVGFGGGHQAKSAWRGWCLKIAPDGSREPWAYGLRSPNGINFSPAGELFYADNQGEWVATNKLHHLKKGRFYGHQASLKWLKDSPFAGKVPETVASGMRYDGVNPAKPNAEKVYPAVEPPAIWFPYGRMGQSATEPRWDTTAGKFGPFAGQCFVGDQTRSMVMRVALEEVNGVQQGACFPFRSGLQCGVNRIVFGPDGAMYVGQTARGWGSTGGKPYGLQRLRFTGETPPEMHTMTITNDGFAVTFTTPVDLKTITEKAIGLKSFTYIYHSAYGCPETDVAAEKVERIELSDDGRTLTFVVPNRAKGRVYDLQLTDVKTAKGETLLHSEAYYTLNEFPK